MNHHAAAHRRGFENQQALRRYKEHVEAAIEGYKESIPRHELLAIAADAAGRVSIDQEHVGTALLLADEVDRLIFERLRLPSFAEWRRSYRVMLRESPVLVDSRGAPIRASSASGERIIAAASAISDDMIAALAANPQLMHTLDPRRFEELIAEILHRQGMEVRLTPTTRDGGYDVVARGHTPLGSFLCYVECKRYAPGKPVRVGIVRELYGVITAEHATQGIVVTTSRFTKGADAFAARFPHRISLKAYEDLVGWLGAAQGGAGGRR